MRTTPLPLVLLGLLAAPVSAMAQGAPPRGYTPEQCSGCAGWNAPHAAVKLHGNTYWVGTAGLGVILITSDSGHVLIDGGLPESEPLIEASVRGLGFQMSDIRVILNSHAHFDHGGGIAGLQKLSGASVMATPASAAALRRGFPVSEDPQYAVALAFPAVPRVSVVEDGDTVRVGPLAVVAHLTPGHSPGGTTWSWRSCEDGRCLDLVYADSQTPVSADGFRFSEGEAVVDFERGLDAIEGLACDLLVTPHPGASRVWQRVRARDAGDPDALIDPNACRAYAAASREQLRRRLEREGGGTAGLR